MKEPSEESKIKQKRGSIEGGYKAWLQIQEFTRDWGTATAFTDWKTGRLMHFLSKGEFYAYLILRFNDKVEDIYEQFPLDIEKTTAIAQQLGYRTPSNGQKHMTTDLLVKLTDGSYVALSVKSTKDSINPKKHKRVVEKQYIEMLYWKSKKIPWHIIFTENIDNRKALNIKNCAEFWKISQMPTKEEMFRYLIIHKEIDIDLSRKISFADEAEIYIPDDTYNKLIGERP